jgi:hypothetical protein
MSEKHGRLIREKQDVSEKFIAWARPFDRYEYVAKLRIFISELYKVEELPADAVWGFKEVRYDSVVARVLSLIFPEGRFIVLQRDFVDFFLSWNRAFNQAKPLDYSIFKNVAKQYIDTYESFISMVPEIGEDRVRHVRYEDLCASPLSVMDNLFEWLKLSIDDAVKERVIATSHLVVDYVNKKNDTSRQQVVDFLGKLNNEEADLGNRFHKLCPNM